uniref:Uncharacterized protein n=1 Tax=Anguilla anguilla TaxID=7936 RepID=A0A0E9WKV2_ANGAN
MAEINCASVPKTKHLKMSPNTNCRLTSALTVQGDIWDSPVRTPSVRYRYSRLVAKELKTSPVEARKPPMITAMRQDSRFPMKLPSGAARETYASQLSYARISTSRQAYRRQRWTRKMAEIRASVLGWL